MLKGQNKINYKIDYLFNQTQKVSRKLFDFIKNYRVINFIVLQITIFCFIANPAFATISFSQCEEELSKHCDRKRYKTTQEKENCIMAKQDFFTPECIEKITGIQPTKKAKHNSKEDVANDNKINNKKTDKIIQEQNKTISNLNTLLLTSNCLADISRFCKTKVRKGKTTLKENEKSCINRLVQHEKHLTMNCRGILLNMLSNSSDKQYKINNINNIAITSGQSLKQVSESMSNEIDEKSKERELKMIVKYMKEKLPIRYAKMSNLDCNPDDENDYETQADSSKIAKQCLTAFTEHYSVLRQSLTEDEYFNFRSQYLEQKGYKKYQTDKNK